MSDQLHSPEVQAAARTVLALPGFAARRERLVTLRLAGSRSYGTHHADSDVDLRGVFMATDRELLGTGRLPENLKYDEPDALAYELGKFMALAAKGNPGALEMLWAPAVLDTEVGERLTAHRQLFLSQALVPAYGGYAMQQLRKAKEGSGGSRGVAHFKRVKFMLHLKRLTVQGKNLVSEGDMKLRVENPQELFAFAERAVVDLDYAEKVFREWEVEFYEAASSSPLPETPNWEALDELLVEMRLEHLHGRNPRRTVGGDL